MTLEILNDNTVLTIIGTFIVGLIGSLWYVVQVLINLLKAKWIEYVEMNKRRFSEQTEFNQRIESAVRLLVNGHNQLESEVKQLKNKIK